jgi:putative membrane protein insertion efficiency factor
MSRRDGTAPDAVAEPAPVAHPVDDVPATDEPARPRSLGARAAVGAVRWYQVWISPNLMPSCRFHPSCSAYAVEALGVHGLVRGLGLTVWRLLRCAPWHPGGWDPVPPRRRPRGRSRPPTGDPPERPSTDPPRTEGFPSGADR